MKPVGTLVGSGQFRRSHRHRGAGTRAGPGAVAGARVRPGAVAGARAQGQDGKRCLEVGSWWLIKARYICLYRK